MLILAEGRDWTLFLRELDKCSSAGIHHYIDILPCFTRVKRPPSLVPQHLHVGKSGSFQTLCCVGYPCLDLPSRGGLRTTGHTAGDRRTGLYICFAALWGGEGASRSD